MDWSILDDNLYEELDKPANGFWEFGEFEDDFPGSENPWQHGTDMAPFDTGLFSIFMFMLRRHHEVSWFACNYSQRLITHL